MTNEELKLKLQALVDNELPEEEIPAVMSSIEGSYELREEYIALLRLRRRLEQPGFPEPDKEWFEKAARSVPRRGAGAIATFLFVGSYMLLIGYAIASLIARSGASVWIKIGVAGVVVGLVIFLIVTIADRMRESRSDRYKEVMK